MKRLLMTILIALLMATGVLGLGVSPTSWTHTYDSSDGILPTLNISITNSANSSVDIEPSFSGDLDIYELDDFTVNANSTKSVILEMTREPEESGKFVTLLSLGDSTVPLILTATIAEEDSCKLTPLVSHYITRIKASQDSLPFTKTFSVAVSPHCESPVTINEPILQETIMADKEVPIELVGEIYSGEVTPGDRYDFQLSFSSQSLTSGVFTPKVLVTGTDGSGNSIQTEIKFSITISKASSPLTNGSFSDSEYGTCRLSTLHLQSGQPYDLVCSESSNPNIKTGIKYSSDIVGLEVVETSNNDFVWKFKPVVKGDIKLEVYHTYNGLPIGEPTIFNLLVTEEAPSGAGISMMLEFFPSLETLQPGDSLSFLVKDNATKNIISDSKVYVNGVGTEPPFFVEQGKTFVITASHPNYPTYETSFLAVPRPIQLLISPTVPEVGQEIIIVSTPPNAKIFINGLEWPEEEPFVPTAPGEYVIRANKPPFADAETILTVLSPLTFLEPVGNLTAGKTVTLELTREVAWEVLYEEDIGEPAMQIATGMASSVVFVTQKPGTYIVEAEGREMARLTAISKPFYRTWTFWGAIVVIILVVYWYWKKSSGGVDEFSVGLDGGEFGGG